MNTRIQVEHPVTEMITGLDLVAMQLRLAAGEPLAVSAQTDVTALRPRHRVPDLRRAPGEGLPALARRARQASTCRPRAESVRIDTGVREGDRVTHFYDPMIAKVIVLGADRGAAIDRMLATLAAITIEGVETNLAFLQKVIAHAAFRAGDVRTGFVDRFKKELL